MRSKIWRIACQWTAYPMIRALAYDSNGYRKGAPIYRKIYALEVSIATWFCKRLYRMLHT